MESKRLEELDEFALERAQLDAALAITRQANAGIKRKIARRMKRWEAQHNFDAMALLAGKMPDCVSRDDVVNTYFMVCIGPGLKELANRSYGKGTADLVRKQQKKVMRT